MLICCLQSSHFWGISGYFMRNLETHRKASATSVYSIVVMMFFKIFQSRSSKSSKPKNAKIRGPTVFFAQGRSSKSEESLDPPVGCRV